MSTASKHSPLLALPKELRLMIYDELFAPLIKRPEHFDTYVLPSEWPKIDFTSYRALLLTCKEVKEEATTHFEGHFLRDVIVYFDNVIDLRDFYSKLERAPDSEKLADMRVCLHTLPWCIGDHIAPEVMAGSDFKFLNVQTFNCCCDMLTGNNDGPSQAREVSHDTRGSAKVAIYRRISRSEPFAKGLQPITRKLCSEFGTEYTQTVVPIASLRGHEWVLSKNRSESKSILGLIRKGTGGSVWPGTKEYEQELKEKYELDA